jgi:hypothetical protein
VKMKLVFRKDHEEQITVFQSVDGTERPFAYSEMVNMLIRSRKLETPEALGDFTEKEKRSINSMVDRINEVLPGDAEPDEGAGSAALKDQEG